MISGLTDQSACLASSGILHVVGDGAAGGGTTVVLQLARGLAAGVPGSLSQAKPDLTLSVEQRAQDTRCWS